MSKIIVWGPLKTLRPRTDYILLNRINTIGKTSCMLKLSVKKLRYCHKMSHTHQMLRAWTNMTLTIELDIKP